MKYLYTILLTIALLSASAQSDCFNEVSTFPINPYNNALPILGGSNTADERYLNKFDWLPIGAPGTPEEGLLLGYPLSNMQFAGTPLPIMSNIMSDQGTIEYYEYIYKGRRPLTENGWELLLVNVGRFPDNETEIPINAAELSQFPYIVIYNKYLSKIRIFCKFGLDQTVHSAADAVEIELSFVNDEELNGLMRLYEGKDRPLDKETNITKMKAITKAQNFGNKWYSADFQVAYDPCVCSYPSQIKMTFAQVKRSSITAHSRTVTLEDVNLVDNDLVVEPSEWLSGFDYTGEVAAGGVAIARSLKSMTSRYIAELEQYKIDYDLAAEQNAKIERRLAVMKLFENIVIEGGSTLVSAVLGLPFIDKINEFADDLVGIEVIDSTALVAEGKKHLASGVKGLKTLIAGEMVPEPKKPEIPTATFSETSYSGQTEQYAGFAGPTFYTPGSYGTYGTGSPEVNSVYRYPVYNEALGTFALLKTPKFKISKYLLHNENDLVQEANHPVVSLWNLKMQRYQAWSKSYKIGLHEGLQFALNQNIGIKSYDIQVAFVVKPKIVKLNEPNNDSKYAVYMDNEKLINSFFTSFPSTEESFKPIIYHEKDFHELRDMPELYGPYWDNIQEETEVEILLDMETPFIPIDAIQQFEVGVGLRNEVVGYKDHQYTDADVEDIDYTTNPLVFDLTDPDIIKPTYYSPNTTGLELEFEIELRILVDIEFEQLNSEGRNNRVTEIHSYIIDDSDIIYPQTSTNITAFNNTNDISQYPENMMLKDITFGGQEVDNCVLNGSTYTCRAWNNVKIEGNLTTLPGFNVNIIAGNEIVEGDVTLITPEITRYIERSLDFSVPNPPQTQTEVQNFCGNKDYPQEYAANIGSKSSLLLDGNSITDISDNFTKGVFNLTLYPNPTSNYVNVKFSHPTDILSFKLYDLSGRKVPVTYELLNQDGAKVSFEGLQQGVYTLITETVSGSFTNEIVVDAGRAN